MPTVAQIVVGAASLFASGFLALLLWNVTRAMKNFDTQTELATERHEATQKVQTDMLLSLGAQQEQIKTLFIDGERTRQDVQRLEDDIHERRVITHDERRKLPRP